MRVLVSGCSKTMRRELPRRPDRLGVLAVPGAGNRLPPAPTVWAADNGCYAGLDAPAFLRMLAKVVAHPHRPLWVTCPDVVADAVATWGRWLVWGPVIRDALGLPVAFVLQDGCRPYFAPGAPMAGAWDRLDAVFVGGTTAFKYGPDAEALTAEAHARGKWVHFGRVNTLRQLVWLARRMRDGRLWVDTIDGGTTKFGDVYVPKLCRWIDRAIGCGQKVLFEDPA